MPRKPILASLLAATLALVLSGCVTAQVNLTVNADNSGTFGVSMGISKQLLALAGANSSDLMKSGLGDDIGAENVQVRQWSEGDTEWTEASLAFRNFDELNERIKSTELFDRFTLDHQRGILKDRFILDIQIGTLSDQLPDSSNDLGLFDPADMLNFNFTATLPGEITQTNGVFSGKTSNIMMWNIDFNQPTTIHAESEVWNWVNIAIIGASAFVLLMLTIILLVALVRNAQKKKQAMSQKTLGTQTGSPISPTANRPTPSPGFDFRQVLELTKAKILLEQVNQHRFNDLGIISETPRGLRLSAPDNGANFETLEISVIDKNVVQVNGREYPSTTDGIKQGLLNALKSH